MQTLATKKHATLCLEHTRHSDTYKIIATRHASQQQLCSAKMSTE